MANFGLCLKCGKKYEKNDYNLAELVSSRAVCRNDECQGNICRTDAWGYPIADTLRQKGYPIFHCYVSNHENSYMMVLVFFGENLDEQLKNVVDGFTYGEPNKTGNGHFLYYTSFKCANKVEAKRMLKQYQEEILKRAEQLKDYVAE